MKRQELIEFRKRVGLSKMKLSDRTGIGRYKFSDFEMGYADLKPEEMAKAIAVLKEEESRISKTEWALRD